MSRFYRAPEVILGMPYDHGVDMWSIGCTLYELYTGKILFTGDSNNQMLKTIMEIRGRLTPKLYKRGQLSGAHFDDQGQFVSVERDKMTGKVRFWLRDYFFFFRSPLPCTCTAILHSYGTSSAYGWGPSRGPFSLYSSENGILSNMGSLLLYARIVPGDHEAARAEHVCLTSEMAAILRGLAFSQCVGGEG